ncbi:MAG TPA: hypothetical protein VNT03_08845 [Baekduia sp.]|nr:hypothetical protein [Baekduia sp.]
MTIRTALPDDSRAIARLAALDSARVPAGPLLLAEIDGEPWAAIALSSGRAIADPFRPTAALVDLLRRRAAQLATPEQGRFAASWVARGRLPAGRFGQEAPSRAR